MHRAALALPLALAACAVAPITGRRQLLLLSPREEVRLGEEAYREALKDYRVVRAGPRVALLRRVLARLEPFAAMPYRWEVTLLDADSVVNAWALPGGKIAFYTGILKFCRGEDEIAAVMGHEMAHAIAHHGNERISLNLGLTTLGQVLADLLGRGGDPARRARVLAAFGITTKLGLSLPFSRRQEQEADEIGLHLMVRAGYDPWAAVRLWERMAARAGPDDPLAAFLSTHPAPRERARRLRALIPSVLARYGRS